MEKWTLTEVLHSGRKGERDTPVDNPKYDDIIGWTVGLDKDNLKPFEEFRFYFKGHPKYDYWTTTAVIEAHVFCYNTMYVETVNTIYVFERVEENTNG